jgi:hypothetical protein
LSNQPQEEWIEIQRLAPFHMKKVAFRLDEQVNVDGGVNPIKYLQV